MNYKLPSILVVLASLALFCAEAWFWIYRPRPAASAPTPATRTITDLTGRTVQVPERPKRILSLCTTATATLIAMNEGDRLAGMDEYSRVVPGTERVRVIGKGSAISQEQVTALQIDLAFIWWYQDDAADALQRLSVPIVRMPSARAKDVPAVIRLIGSCVQLPQVAEALAGELEAFLRQSKPALAPGEDRLRVFVELYGPYKTSGRDTYLNDLIELAGASNVAAELKGSVLLSAERLAQLQPRIVLCAGDVDPALFKTRPGMAELRAVREGRVAALDRRWLVAGPNLPQAAAELRKIIQTINGK